MEGGDPDAIDPAANVTNMESEVERLKALQLELMGTEVPDRRPRIWRGDQLRNAQAFRRAAPEVTEGGAGGGGDAPATLSDAALLQRALRRQREQAAKSEQFQTKAMRELETLKESVVYKTTLIRIQFPDRGMPPAALLYCHKNMPIRACVSSPCRA